MADKIIICKNCGSEFTFTEGEQAFYKEKGFSEPQSCPACRAKRKAARQGENQGNNFNRPRKPRK